MFNINKSGYLVHFYEDGSRKTYACSNMKGLKDLIYHLTGRDSEAFPKDTRGLPRLDSVGVAIGYPLHIWE